jgi:hypothetical protein
MGLTPPSQLAFFLAVLLAICALLVHYAHVAIPVVNTHSFETLLVGFLILLAGVLFRGSKQRNLPTAPITSLGAASAIAVEAKTSRQHAMS